jgi:hypothetical protein
MAATHVALFERDDIAWRGDRHLLTQVNDIAQRPGSRRRRNGFVEAGIDANVLRPMLIRDVAAANYLITVMQRLTKNCEFARR